MWHSLLGKWATQDLTTFHWSAWSMATPCNFHELWQIPIAKAAKGMITPALVLFKITRDPWFFFTVQGGLNSSIFVWIAGGPPAQLGPILGAMLGYVDNAWRPARAPSVLGMDVWDVSYMWQDSSRWGIWVNFRGPSNPWKFKNMNTPLQRNFG